MKKLIASLIAIFLIGGVAAPAAEASVNAETGLFKSSKSKKRTVRAKKNKSNRKSLRQARQLKKRYTRAHYPGQLRK